MVEVPGSIAAAFVLLVVALGVLLLVGLNRGLARLERPTARRLRTVRLVGLGLGLWLLLTGAAAARGVFLRFNALPPPIAFAIVPAIAAAFVVGSSRAARVVADAVPGRWIVALQSFRIVVEIILWRLAVHHALPEVMTWNGRNFDVVTGLTAPLVAYLGFADGRSRRTLLTLWNVAGLLLVTNVFVHGMLSAPTPFRVLVTDPPNTVIGQLPFVWLPAFVVPIAYFLHIVSLRRDSRRREDR